MLHQTSGRSGGFGIAAASHTGINCDQCGVAPIIGVRYRCSMCSNYDLCSKCIEPTVKQHPKEHLFLRIDAGEQATLVANYPVVVSRTPLVNPNACTGCAASNFTGFRFQCVQCQVDLCQTCESRGVHDPTHPRMKFAAKSAPPPAAPSFVPAVAPAPPPNAFAFGPVAPAPLASNAAFGKCKPSERLVSRL